jgi:hypothetical protein
MPGLMMVAAFYLDRGRALESRSGNAAFIPFFFVTLILLLSLAAPLVANVPFIRRDRYLVDAVMNLHPYCTLLALALVVAMARGFRNTDALRRLALLGALTALAVSWLQIQAGQKIYEYYDLSALAQAVQLQKDRPMAVVGNYQGEIGFLARVTRPMDLIQPPYLGAWFQAHPDGVALLKTREENTLAPYHVLFRKSFRSARKQFALIENIPENP